LQYYLDDFEFAIGNQHFREDYDQYFGFQNANVDLSRWDYDFVWPGWQGVLKVSKGMGLANDLAMLDTNPEVWNQTTWVRMVELEQTEHYVGGCAESCASIDSPAGFHAHNAQRGEWDCMCLFPGLTLDYDTCFAGYTNTSSAALDCFVNSTVADDLEWFDQSYFAWNDTFYHMQPFIFFSKESMDVVKSCTDEELEDFCESPEELLKDFEAGKPQSPRKGAYFPQNPNDPDGQYWQGCTLPGFSCDDYNHEQCEDYGRVCGAELGQHEVPCSGLVSVTYITCPAVMTTLGSSLGYLSYLELLVVTILVSFFLWWRGENPWYVLKANMIQLGKTAATTMVKAELAKMSKERAKKPSYLDTTGVNIFGADEYKKMQMEMAAMKNIKGVQGVMSVPAATSTSSTPTSTSSGAPVMGQRQAAQPRFGSEERETKDFLDASIHEFAC
jgi:hypothetical protein